MIRKVERPTRIATGVSAGSRRSLPACLGWFWNRRILGKEAPQALSRLVKFHAVLWIASYAFYGGRMLFG
jgi:hypothetical protein